MDDDRIYTLWPGGRGDLLPLMDGGAVHALILFHQFSKLSLTGTPRSLWRACLQHDREMWDTVLLPIARSAKPTWSARLFWYAISRNHCGLAQWTFEQGLVSLTSEPDLFDEYEDMIGTYTRNFPELSTLEAMRACDFATQEFWARFMWCLWRQKMLDRLFNLAELCKFVPKIICRVVDSTVHEKLMHICGCNSSNSKRAKLVE